MQFFWYKWFYFSLYERKPDSNNKKQAWAPFSIFSSAVLHIMQQELKSLKK